MKRFATLFPFLGPEHVTKDVGRIPALLQDLGFDSMLVGIEKEGVVYPKIKMKLGLLKAGGLRGHLEMNVLSFLQSESKNIDILNLYHLRRDTIFYGQWYKKANPKGFLYLKMDSYNEELEKGVRYSSNFFKNVFFNYQARKFLKCCDLISAENRQGVQLLKKSFPAHAHKVMYLPNGVDLGPAKKFDKEKIILSVGRLDDPVKNYAAFLETLATMDLQGFKVFIVGKGYEEIQEKLFESFPELRASVFFKGEIKNRKTLFELYNRALIYVQPSLHESFGLAMAEALCHGCYLVGTSGMSAFEDLSKEGTFGTICPAGDMISLKKVISSLITQGQTGLPHPQSLATFGREHFAWKSIAKKLAEKIERGTNI